MMRRDPGRRDRPGSRALELYGSEGRDVRRLRALRALRDLELDLLVLLERAVAARRNGGVVREDVGSAVLGGDEAEALLGVEPLHGANRHDALFSHVRYGQPRRTGTGGSGVRRPAPR